MHYLIIAVLVLALLAVILVLTSVLGFVAAGVTVPSVFAMILLGLVGLTDPTWPHALLGAAVGACAHLAHPYFRKARRWPFTEAVVRLRTRLTGRWWGYAILILLLLIMARLAMALLVVAMSLQELLLT